MADKMPRVTVIGAGLTGAVTAYLARIRFGNGTHLTVLDKGRGAGGRMATSRCPSNPELTCDLGAQYITATKEYFQRHERYYKELTENQILQPFSIESGAGKLRHQLSDTHFIAPKGSSSIVKYFLSNSGANVQYGYHCDSINWEEASNCWSISAKSQHDQIHTDVIVLTIPVPQILALNGNIQQMLNDRRTDLEAVTYSSRYALGLFFNSKVDLDVPWSFKYVEDDPLIRYISIDTKKRNQENNGTSMVIHSSAPYGIEHIDDDIPQIGTSIHERLKHYFPALPKPDSVKPQRWRYSQVWNSFKDSPGCLAFSNNNSLILGGDAFTHSNFDGCIASGEAVNKVFNEIKSLSHL